MFCLSANEQRKRDQIAASKSDGNAYVIAVVDNLVPGSGLVSSELLWDDRTPFHEQIVRTKPQFRTMFLEWI